MVLEKLRGIKLERERFALTLKSTDVPQSAKSRSKGRDHSSFYIPASTPKQWQTPRSQYSSIFPLRFGERKQGPDTEGEAAASTLQPTNANHLPRPAPSRPGSARPSLTRGGSFGRQVNIGKTLLQKKAAQKVQIKLVDHVSINQATRYMRVEHQKRNIKPLLVSKE